MNSFASSLTDCEQSCCAEVSKIIFRLYIKKLFLIFYLQAVITVYLHIQSPLKPKIFAYVQVLNAGFMSGCFGAIPCKMSYCCKVLSALIVPSSFNYPLFGIINAEYQMIIKKG